MNKIETAILVPAHAAFQASVDVRDVPYMLMQPDPWVFLDFQRNGGYDGRGEQTLYMEHLARGLQIAAFDPSSVLLLSGGHTRAEAGQGDRGWSEAASYYGAALGLIPDLGLTNTDVLDRTLIEEGATDSFQNVEKSAALFQRVLGYPAKEMLVFGFGFKEKRFHQHYAELARNNDQFPHVVYIHVNNPVGDDLVKALPREEKTRRDFEQNPRGDGGDLLKKRIDRTFSGRQSPYPQAALEAKFLERQGLAIPQPLPFIRQPVLAGIR